MYFFRSLCPVATVNIVKSPTLTMGLHQYLVTLDAENHQSFISRSFFLSLTHIQRLSFTHVGCLGPHNNCHLAVSIAFASLLFLLLLSTYLSLSLSHPHPPTLTVGIAKSFCLCYYHTYLLICLSKHNQRVNGTFKFCPNFNKNYADL